MSSRSFRFLLSVAAGFALLSPAGARAVEEETFGFRRGAFLACEPGARPTGMGGAFTALADDASAISWNPGGLGQLQTTQAVAMFDNAVQGLAVYYAAVAMPAGFGVAGLSVVGLTYGSYDMRDISGALQGSENPADVAFAVSYAFGNQTWLGVKGWSGVAVEVVQEAVGGMMGGLSIGSVIPLSRDFTAGWSVQHIGPPEGGFSLPVTARGGIVVAAAPPVKVSMDLGYGVVEKEFWVATGGELDVRGLVLARAGYKYNVRDQGLRGLSGLSLGGGFRLGYLGLDYAYLPRGDLGASHKMSLVYSFPVPAPVVELGEDVPEGAAAQDYRAGLRLASSGAYDQALRKAKSAVDANPYHWQSWQLLGTCRYYKGDLEGAMEAYRRSLKLYPDNPLLKAFMRKLAEGEVEEAPPQPGSGAIRIYEEALSLYESKQYDAAWAKTYAALKADPDHWQSWQLIGNCQYAKGDRQGALASYRRSLAINPDNPGLKAWIERVEKE